MAQSSRWFLAVAVALACLAPADAAVQLWWVKENVLYNEAVYQCKVNNGILARYEVTPKALTDLSARYGTHGTACTNPYYPLARPRLITHVRDGAPISLERPPPSPHPPSPGLSISCP